MLLAAFALCTLSHGMSFADSCQVATSIPSDLKSVGSGSATAERDGVTTIRGGQAVYVRIKNANVLGVVYKLTIEQNTSPAVPNCTYKAILPPGTSVILWGSLFAEPPIGWKITVAVGEESDAGVLTYEVFSQPNGGARKKSSVSSRKKACDGFRKSGSLRLTIDPRAKP